MGTIVGLWALFNLVFVGVGGAIGNAGRPKPQEPAKVHINITNASEKPKPTDLTPREEPYQSEIVWTKDGKIVETDALKRRVLGYLLAYKYVELKAIASRFNVDRNQIEEIILELIADGKIKGFIDPQTETFHVREFEQAKGEISHKESSLAEKESIENYLNMLDQRLAEGKISEATYMALKEKFEAKIKLEREKRLYALLYVPISRIINQIESIIQFLYKGKLRINRDKMLFIEDHTDRTVKFKLLNIEKIQMHRDREGF